MEIKRFNIMLINLDPTQGSEMKKTRPCLVISPDEINAELRTLIIAPMTTQGRSYPTRLPCQFKGKSGLIVLDQLRTIDRSRCLKKLGILDSKTQGKVLDTLSALFTR